MAEFGLTYEEIAEIVGMTLSGISKLLCIERPIKNVVAAAAREVGLNAAKCKSDKQDKDGSDQ